MSEHLKPHEIEGAKLHGGRRLQWLSPVDGRYETRTDTPLLKALRTENAQLSAANAALGRVAEAQTVVLKSLTTQVAALQKSVAALGTAPAGRKSTVQLPTAQAQAAKAHATGQGLLAKSMALQAQGQMTSLDVGTVETCLARGAEIPAHLLARLSAA